MATRRMLLDALTAQWAEGGAGAVSMPKVASRAGVALRTLYRHFPSRAALFAAAEAELDERLSAGMKPSAPEDLALSVARLGKAWEENAALLRLTSRNAPEPKGRPRRRRGPQFGEMLRASFTGLGDLELARAAAILQLLLSAETWPRLRDGCGLAPLEAALTLEWAVATLVAELRASDERGRRRGRAGARSGAARLPVHSTRRT